MVMYMRMRKNSEGIIPIKRPTTRADDGAENRFRKRGTASATIEQGSFKMVSKNVSLKMGRATCSAGLATIALWSAAASAQQQTAQGSAVADRSRPEYGQEPIRIGGIEIFPSFDIDAEYNDNIFGSSQLKSDDVVFSVSPAVTVFDRRADRDVTLRARAGVDVYASGSYDPQFFGSLDGSARLRKGTITRPYFGAGISRNSSRGRSDSEDFLFVAQPVSITTLRANAGVERDFGPFTADIEARGTRTQFDGNFRFNNQIIDVGFRDYNVYSGRAQLSYSQSPNQRLYVSVEANKQDFASPVLTPGVPAFLLTNRSSDGYRIEVGIARQVTDLILLDARIGYLKQNFDDPAIGSTSGLAFQASATYNPTALTTIKATALRAVDNSSNPLSAGLVRTEFQLRVDHELRRNVILTGTARYGLLNQSILGGDAKEFSAAAEARYLVNKRWSITARVEHYDRSGFFGFAQKRAKIGVRYNF